MTSTTLAAAMTAGSQTITLASGTLTVDALVAIDSEYVSVVEVFSATAGRVQRGVNGSSAAAHDNGAAAIIGTGWEFLTGPAIVPPFGQSDDALTAQGPSAAPVYGGGGGSILHQATVTLTNDQIIHLPTTPIELIPAPVAGTVLIPVAGAYILDTTAAAYTNVATPDSALGIGTSFIGFGNVLNSSGDLGSITDLTDFLAAGSVVMFRFCANTATVDGASNEQAWAEFPPAPVAINVMMVNAAAGNLHDGDPANTMIVSVAYLTLNYTTGQFE